MLFLVYLLCCFCCYNQYYYYYCCFSLIIYPQYSDTGCLLGANVTIERRRPDVCCLNGHTYNRVVNYSTCPCTLEDFEWLVENCVCLLMLQLWVGGVSVPKGTACMQCMHEFINNYTSTQFSLEDA